MAAASIASCAGLLEMEVPAGAPAATGEAITKEMHARLEQWSAVQHPPLTPFQPPAFP